MAQRPQREPASGNFLGCGRREPMGLPYLLPLILGHGGASSHVLPASLPRVERWGGKQVGGGGWGLGSRDSPVRLFG